MTTNKIKFEFEGDPRDLKRALGEASESFGNTESKFSDSGSKIALAVGAAFATDKIIDFGRDLFDSGTELETWRVKSETVFGDQLAGVQEWADANNEAMGVTDERLVSMAANMADLLKPMGFTSEAAAGMSTDMVELSGALSAWSGGTVEAAEVADILSKAMLGETDGLKQLGISMNAEEINTRALSIAQLEGRDSITELDKALAVQQLTLEKSTDAQTAWSDGSMDAIKNQNELKAEIAEVKEGLASALMPAFQGVVGFLVADAIPAIKSVSGFIADNKLEIGLAAGILTAAFVPALVASAAAAWSAAGGVAALTAPVSLTAIAIAGLAAGVIWAYENVDEFRAVVDAAVGFLTDTAAPAVVSFTEAAVDAFTWMWDKSEPVINFVTAAIGAYIDIGRNVIGFFTNVFTGDWEGAWNNIKGLFVAAWDLVTAPLELFPDLISEMPGKIRDAALGMFDGIGEAAANAFGGVVRMWNDMSFTFPEFSGDWNGPLPGGGFTVGGWTLNTPNLPVPSFHSGGVFRAPQSGGVGMALLRDGEPVGVGSVATQGGGGGGDIILVLNDREFGRILRDQLTDETTRGGPVPMTIVAPA